MIGMQGVTGVGEPANARRAEERAPRPAAQAAATTDDDVQISPEAHRAVEVRRLLELTGAQSEIRAERVAEARQNLEQGTYRLQEVVLQAAARISASVTLS